jgi:5-deoxy-5-amino-3-dehydroquinate synthase
MMGSGKSTVGPLLARRLGHGFADLDTEIEATAGRSVRELFAERGEAEFRRLEAEALAAVLDRPTPQVIGTGGGVVLAEANRRRLDAAATVVWLAAPPDVLARRVGGDPGRPLLAGGDPEGTLARLLEERNTCYRATARFVVAAAPGLPEQVAERVAARLRPPEAPLGLDTVPVDLGTRGYEVLVGPGARERLPAVLPAGTRRAAVVGQPSCPVEVDPGIEHRVFAIGDGEAAKSLATVEQLCRGWAAWGLTRADCVVAVGGGVVTDVAGFAASAYHRGIPVVHVPTTLLGQVDAAIGGKTGVNLPEGKNLVGAFWQPAAVLCDTEVLASLPEREYRSGLGELAKYHFLGGADLDRLALPARVAASVAIKAAVVAGDEREAGGRAILNYGHTLAHALEVARAFDLRHGEAVAIGLVFAAELARALGRIDTERVAEHRRVVAAYGLPATLPPGADPDQLVELMARDKKALRGLTFVLDGPAGVEPVSGVERGALDEAFAAVAVAAVGSRKRAG